MKTGNALAARDSISGPSENALHKHAHRSALNGQGTKLLARTQGVVHVQDVFTSAPCVRQSSDAFRLMEDLRAPSVTSPHTRVSCRLPAQRCRSDPQ